MVLRVSETATNGHSRNSHIEHQLQLARLSPLSIRVIRSRTHFGRGEHLRWTLPQAANHCSALVPTENFSHGVALATFDEIDDFHP